MESFFNLEIIAKICAPIITAIFGLLLKKYLEDKPKLITYMIQASAIPLRDENNTNVNTHSIVVRNAGRKTANNIRIGHNILPQSYQLFPQLQHKVVTEGPNQHAEIIIPTLVPNEQINISYLYGPPMTWNQIHSYCKSDEMSAKYVNVVPSPQLGRFQKFVLWSLIFVGSSTLVYWLILLVWGWIKLSSGA
jgi:hypothetical protein